MPVTEKQKMNLIPFGKLSPRERTEIARKGAKATNEKRAMNKVLGELLENMGKHRATDNEKKVLQTLFPDMDEKKLNKAAMIVGSLFNQGISKGNIKAIELLMKLYGLLPNATEVTGSIVTQKVFVTQEERKAALDHIHKVIEDDGEY